MEIADWSIKENDDNVEIADENYEEASKLRHELLNALNGNEYGNKEEQRNDILSEFMNEYEQEENTKKKKNDKNITIIIKNIEKLVINYK